ncbi:MAG: hypothetical protein P1U61_02445 [Legionellaceae bacterium]|nr:hypothetical protein [Legionellaceae bacterium]
MRLRSKMNPSESNHTQLQKHIDFIRRNISDGQVTVLVSPTLINTDNITSIRKKFIDSERLTPEELSVVTPGHISAYTPEAFVSHRRTMSKNPLEQDVEDTMKLAGYDVYLGIFPEELFTELSFDREIGQYHVSAPGETDNCSTAAQRVLLDEKDKSNGLNPLTAFKKIIFNAFNNTDFPLESDNDELLSGLKKLGINRTLEEYSKQYRAEQKQLTSDDSLEAKGPIL